MERSGQNQIALEAFLKVIEKRGDDAPESHLEAGLIYLNHIKDPIAAIYHFRKYIEIKPNSARGQQVEAKAFGHEVARGAKVCTQVVAAALPDAAASPLHRYAVDILVRGSGVAEAQELLDPEARAVQAEYFELVQEWREQLQKEIEPLGSDLEVVATTQQEALFGLTEDRIVRAGGPELPASCVTPRDLETSPSLARVGRLPSP